MLGLDKFKHLQTAFNFVPLAHQKKHLNNFTKCFKSLIAIPRLLLIHNINEFLKNNYKFVEDNIPEINTISSKTFYYQGGISKEILGYLNDYKESTGGSENNPVNNPFLNLNTPIGNKNNQQQASEQQLAEQQPAEQQSAFEMSKEEVEFIVGMALIEYEQLNFMEIKNMKSIIDHVRKCIEQTRDYQKQQTQDQTRDQTQYQQQGGKGKAPNPETIVYNVINSNPHYIFQISLITMSYIVANAIFIKNDVSKYVLIAAIVSPKTVYGTTSLPESILR
jgi:hypothetical protein